MPNLLSMHLWRVLSRELPFRFLSSSAPADCGEGQKGSRPAPPALYFSIIILILLFPHHAFTQNPSELEKVTVEAGSKEPQWEATSSATVLTREDLEGRKTSLGEVLNETAGIQIKRYGGLQDFATVSIRGSTSEQVALYLDGVLLNAGQGGGYNVASIPLDSIERIEIYRGSAPAPFANSSIGGVVAITSRQSSKDSQAIFSTSYGSFDTYHESVMTSQKFEILDYLVQYNYLHSDGDFKFLDTNGTPFNAGDDETVSRQNNELKRHNLLTKFGYLPKDKWRLDLSNTFHREDRGIPGLGTLTSLTADLSSTRNQTSLGLKKEKVFASHDSLGLQPFFVYSKQQFSDPNSEIGLSAQENDDDTFQYGSALSYRLPLETQQITGLVHYQGEQFLPENFLATPSRGGKSYRNHITLGLEDEIFIMKGNFLIHPGLRFEGIFNRFSGEDPSFATPVAANTNSHFPVSGKVGLRWNLSPHWALKSQVNRGSRVPNFTELFGERGSIIGNATLAPESSYNGDLGASFVSERFSIEGIYFLSFVSNMIQFLQNSQFTIRPENLSKARIQGIEGIASFLPWKHLKGTLNYTYQQATDISGLPATDGKSLPGRPVHDLNARVELFYASKTWGSTLFTAFEFLDDNFLDSQNLLRVDHRTYLNSGWEGHWRWIKFTFEVKNILNDQTTDVVGYPLPGRNYMGELTVTL